MKADSRLPIEPITLTIADTTRITGFARSRVYLLLAAGKLRAVREGRRTLVLGDSIKKYLASLPAAEFRPNSPAE